MSSLWTPGGEIPVDRNAPDPGPSQAATGSPPQASPEARPDAARSDEELDEMRRQLLAAPAADVIAQHLMAFFELAAMHVSADTPRLADAKLAIDAIETLLEGLAGRLGPAESAISSALPELKLAFVDAKDRAAG